MEQTKKSTPVSDVSSPDPHVSNSMGLRISPMFDSSNRVVELVATVVSDMKVKKHKKKKNKKKKGKKLTAKTEGANKHVVVASLQPSQVLSNSSADIKLSDDAKSSKLAVYNEIQKSNIPIKLIDTPEAIETLLGKEMKTESSAFYLVNLGTLVDRWYLWKQNLPRVQPFYAIKSNPDINIVRTLSFLGCNFDCASKSEIEEVLSLKVSPKRIIFANPCKGADHIQYAKDHGVEMMTFDNVEEVDKVHKLYPQAKMVLRILPDDSHSTSPLGTKFGAPFEECKKLIAACKANSINLIGVSFHVGSGCYSIAAYVEALKLARKVFDEAKLSGYDLTLLDIGGGWPGVENGPVTFSDIANEIRGEIDALFPPEHVTVISEPGRYFCTSSVTLAVNVIGRREKYTNAAMTTTMKAVDMPSDDDDLDLESYEGGLDSDVEADEKLSKFEQHLNLHNLEKEIHDKKLQKLNKAVSPTIGHHSPSPGSPAPSKPAEGPTKEIMYYLSDGIYGSFNNIIFDHATPNPLLYKNPGEASEDIKTKSKLFGPTCDSIDVICQDIQLPELKVGDWLYFMNMGAYTVASASKFNGFMPPNARYMMLLE